MDEDPAVPYRARMDKRSLEEVLFYLSIAGIAAIYIALFGDLIERIGALRWLI